MSYGAFASVKIKKEDFDEVDIQIDGWTDITISGRQCYYNYYDDYAVILSFGFQDKDKCEDFAKELYFRLVFYFKLKGYLLFLDTRSVSVPKKIELLHYSSQTELEREHHNYRMVYNLNNGFNILENIESIEEFDDKRKTGAPNIRSGFSIHYPVINDLTGIEKLQAVDSQKYAIVNDAIDSFINADNMYHNGQKLVAFCGILEHLAHADPSIESMRSEEAKDLLDELISTVKKSELDVAEKDQLCSHLGNGKSQGSRRQCMEFARKYSSGKYTDKQCRELVNRSYGLRSSYSHGDVIGISPEELFEIEKFIIDVIYGYATA